MPLRFAKYQGAGNDFLVIDDRARSFPLERREVVAQLCRRKYGVGADGILLLQQGKKEPFSMRMFNADGSEAGMCGNGIRCLFAFLEDQNLVREAAVIETAVGP